MNGGPHGECPTVEFVHEVKIRMARPGASDAHHHLAGAGSGFCDLDQHRLALPLEQSQGVHITDLLVHSPGVQAPTGATSSVRRAGRR